MRKPCQTTSLVVASPWCAVAALLLLSTVTAAQGQSGIDGVAMQTVVEGLDNPTALALRPGGPRSGSNLFVAEAGAGRVIGLSTDSDSEPPIAALTEFSRDGGGGPSCMVFRSRNRLLVGQSSTNESPATVHEYDIDDDRLPILSSAAKSKLDYKANDKAITLADIARSDDALFVATADHQWLLKTHLMGSKAGELEPFVRPIDATQVGTPRAVTVSAKGYLLAAESGPPGSTGNAILVFHHPVNLISPPLLVLETELDDITALAYSPVTDRLYAAAIAPQSGVYRIDAVPLAGRDGCRAVLVAQVERPTALVFSDDGVLYVTANGGDDRAQGKLLKLTGEL